MEKSETNATSVIISSWASNWEPGGSLPITASVLRHSSSLKHTVKKSQTNECFLPANKQWRKVKQMQPVWLCIVLGKQLGPGAWFLISASVLQLSSDQSGSDSLLFWTKQRVSVKKAIYWLRRFRIRLNRYMHPDNFGPWKCCYCFEN